MDERDLPPIARRFAEPGFVESAIQTGVKEALRGHAQAGRDVPIWQDGRVVWVSAAELLARFEAEERPTPAQEPPAA
jgi:hypothetical protein